MISFLITIGQFLRAIWRGLREPEFRALFTLVAILLLTGTLFYSRVEGWGWLDSFYFCVITLLTVGYGDLTPTHPSSKIFTIVYLFIGIGLLLGFVNTVTQHVLATNQKDRQRLEQMRKGRGGETTSPLRDEPPAGDPLA